VAQSIPNPNTKNHAFIDDFEGSRVFIPLQTAYSIWTIGSIPPELPNNPGANDTTMQKYRAKMDWYNVPITSTSDKTVPVSEIWPDKSVAREDQRVTVLDLDYYPQKHGPFNYDPQIDEDQKKNWAGVLRLLPVNATNLVDGNFNYLEIWMKVEGTDGHTSDQQIKGKLLIDMGKISEEVIPDNRLNTEDDVIPGSIRNGILNPGEDVGLDMLTNAEEQALYAAEIAAGVLDGNDPSGDNFNYNSTIWTQFNGTEGNIDDPAGQFPDTEDLNNNSILDLTRDFFRYTIEIDTTKFIKGSSPRNKYIVGGGSEGWYQFRIPLTGDREEFGAPSLDNIEYLRLILTDFETEDGNVPVNIRIADFNFVGNQWYEGEQGNPHLAVSVVNIEDNPGYTSPPGVFRPRDRTRPDQEIFGNEQSLSLDFEDLPADSILGAYRVFPAGLDLYKYRELKMYVHGDEELSGVDYEMVMRFGIDSSSYYEYRAPVLPGWDQANEVRIKFADLTALKGLQDSLGTPYEAPVPGGPPGSFFKVVGFPDLVRIERISVSVKNDSLGQLISGRLWINEMRVITPNTQTGYAYTASGNFRLADIADISANINHHDAFVRMSRTGI